jgi:regulator of sirC expression with transglutaminase-like and TPR domain
MDQSEIIALISLLEDPDQEIRDQIRTRICEEGRFITPYLQEQKELYDVVGWPILIQNIIEEIKSKELTRELEVWFKGGCEDLVEGAILVARFDDEELDETEVRAFISRLRQEIWLELNENLTAFEKVKVMNIFFFEEYGFKGNKEDYHLPDNSFIHKVIANRSGNPLLLSILYTSIAQSLDIPIRGINLPNHFIVAYMIEDDWLMKVMEPENDIMFYINPFSKGAILHKAEIDQFLSQLDLRPEPRFFEPCGNGDMIRRMINNLMHAYQKRGEEEKVKMLSGFVQLISAPRS